MEEFLSILEPLPRDLAQYVLCAVLCCAVLHRFTSHKLLASAESDYHQRLFGQRLSANSWDCAVASTSTLDCWFVCSCASLIHSQLLTPMYSMFCVDCVLPIKSMQEIPDLYWHKPKYEEFYKSMEKNLDIPNRIAILNKVHLLTSHITTASASHHHHFSHLCFFFFLFVNEAHGLH